ncbi:MAG TPA: rhomboid family intramembrane serine protease [Burkholderiaceae bacterium]|nr:rhomboid family intramembrane serine protease [Burkholderiaceae bacterium]
MFPLPPGTQALLWTNVIAFLLDSYLGGRLSQELALWPIGSDTAGGTGFLPWQLVTYSFFHEGFSHIFLNMLGLVMFGSDIERVWGRSRYLTYYFTCVLSAGLTQLLFTWATGSVGPTVGASGGVFGLLLAFALLFPRRTVILIFPPIPMPAWLFVTVYGVIELLQGVTGTQAGVAHFAHLGGMLGGWLMIRYGRRRR